MSSPVQRDWDREIKTYIGITGAMVVKELLLKMMFVRSEELAEKMTKYYQIYELMNLS